MAAPPPFSILPSSHATARHRFPHSAELERHLRQSIRGQIHFDDAHRALYATDSSNYRHAPIGVVFPLDADDVIAAVAACRQFDAPLLTRGAGTSLAGQGTNAAVILDFSRHMHRIGPVDAVRRTVTVQPGAVLDRIREAAEQHALTFAPDPATHSRCTIGGMIGNNSCGVHGLMGGKTVDNIESLDLLLYDGTRLTVGPTPPAELARLAASGGRIGQIYSGLQSLAASHADRVRREFPNIPRRVSGYNLDELLPGTGFNVARALVGSEGTCAVILNATLRLVESPQFRTLLGIGFSDIFIAADHVPRILEHQPIGLEGVDGTLLDCMRQKQKFLADLELLPGGDGFLIAEFGAASQSESDAKARALATELATWSIPVTTRVYTTAEAARVWHIRESALGAQVFIPGRANGWEGWEDAAVDPARTGDYLRALDKLFREFGYTSPMYGHFGQGCVHMRINFDLESADGILKFRRFLDRAAELVVSFGGSLSGEHGDGQSRGALLAKMYSPEMLDAFRAFKRLWDPDLKLNPHKLIDAAQPHADLRLGADYKPWQPHTHFAFPADNGSFSSAVTRCVGVGACLKRDAGTMCPSFMATGNEMHSTRGRAHLLWEMMQGEILPADWRNPAVKQALDLCLACKACKSECPVSVDVATYKAEFLAHYYAGRPRPLAHYAFGRINLFARISSFAPALVNSIAAFPPIRRIIQAVLHLHPSRTLPRFHRAYTASQPRHSQNHSGGREVILWADTFNNHLHPPTLAAAHKVLQDAGFHVVFPSAHVCCGRPLYDFGMLKTAKKYLLRTLDVLAPHLEQGTPIVVLEPSCASVFRDELLNLLPNDPRSPRLAAQTHLLSEFLANFAPHYTPPRRSAEEKIIVHGHCHQKSECGMQAELNLLRATGASVELLDSGCCGMAGPFGFEHDKYEVSQAIANRRLMPAVAANPAATLCIDGFSCRQQVTQGSAAHPLHLAEILAQGSESPRRS